MKINLTVLKQKIFSIPKLFSRKYFIVCAVIFVSLILVSYSKGYLENPNIVELNSPKWSFDGPLQLSPERGRFTLMYSLIEDKSFHFSADVARLALPDLGYINGNYVSLFAPAVSFIVAPGYFIGKFFGASQVGAFVVISIFAVMNFYLLFKLGNLFGIRKGISIFGATLFLFATPAFAYSVNLYQHHISTFIILLSLYLLFRHNNFWSTLVIFFLCALSIPVDYPNLFLMLPIGFAAGFRLFSFSRNNSNVEFDFNIVKFLGLVGVVPALAFFMWFNYMSYNNPLQFSGTVPSVKAIDEAGKPMAPKSETKASDIQKLVNPNQQNKDAVGFFKTRLMLNGLYIHFISPDRGIVYFAPVVLLGFYGFFVANRKNKYVSLILMAILSMNIILYSMWGDPWGGWAFGSRYLIPGYAILSLFIMFAFEKHKKDLWFVLPLVLLFSYSVYVNSFGAITSIANPPQVEVLSLEAETNVVQKYTYERNVDAVASNRTNSFIYHGFFSEITNVQTYNFVLTSLIILFGVIAASSSYRESKE